MGLTIQQITNLKKEIPTWIDILYANGFTAKQITFALPQMIVESKYFTSSSYLQDLNPLGIKYKPNAPAPDTTAGRVSTENDNYARFGSKDSLAKEYKRILNLQRTGNNIGKPIDAVNLADYNNRLFANGYYQKDAEHKKNYLAGLVAANSYIQKYVPNYLELLKKKSITFFPILLAGILLSIFILKYK
jgi:hypothetical protein